MGSTQPQRCDPTPQLVDTGIVAILRAHDARHVERTAEVLLEEGIRCLEVTMTVPGALGIVAALAARLPAGAALGAGTVTTAAQARESVDSGATFLVCPAVCHEVLEVALDAGVACYPGGFTPTEILDAWRSGATAVKLFPAATGGPAHLKRVREPLPDIPIVPTGGVTVDAVPEYLRCGALAVGMGSPLLGDALDGGDVAALRERAARVHDAVASGRSAP